MKKTEFVALIVRLSAVYLAFILVGGAGQLGQAILGRGLQASSFVTGLWILMGFFAVLLMLFFPKTMARKIIEFHPDDELKWQWSASDFQSVAFSILGLYFILSAFLRLVFITLQFGSFVLIASYRGEPWLYYLVNYGPITISLLVQVAVGIWLMKGAKSLRKIMRDIGLKHQTIEDNERSKT